MIDFLGIGAFKAGTSWLYKHLNRHPAIHFPAGKEIHFWSAYTGGEGSGRLARLGADPAHLSVDWWLGLFPPDVRRQQGEISPPYALLDQATVDEIAALLPELRVFYQVRNPMARAWAQARARLAKAWVNPATASDPRLHQELALARERGAYVPTIRRWHAAFGVRFQVIQFDDIVADPAAVLTGLYRHIGVPDRTIDPAWLAEPVNAGPECVLPMRFLPILRAYYAPRIEALSGLLGRDLSYWLRWDGTRASELAAARGAR